MTAIVHAGQHLPFLVRKLQYIFCFSSTYQANLNVQVLMHTSTDTQMLIVVEPIFALDSLRYLSISVRQDSCLSSMTMTFEGKCQLIFDTTLNLEARILVDHLTCWGKELKTEQV
ncbi:hypothetical protein FOYG_01472 [Fusarium oxysporum NRRL 32931]|uniref:Uncharacterized protein n=1 Tax=Fusarium oxysporum NRRL 32931 TaxID=660029 RepID=W9J8V1_FUSOX|nr:hypothetical protein FOYG_01472 [Fusarium oxysporum NRRL 32931]